MYTEGVGKDNFAFLPTIILPLSTPKDEVFKVRTLLDSGSGASWIAGQVLDKVKHDKLGSRKLKVMTLAGETTKKFRVVLVYFKVKYSPVGKYHMQSCNEVKAVQCFVLDSFVEHVMIEGMREYLVKYTDLTEQDLCNIVYPSEKDVDHKAMSMGIGLVLSNADASLVYPSSSRRINIQAHKLILDQTLFGLTLSGIIPQSLRDRTEYIQANFIRPMLAEDNEKHVIRLESDVKPDNAALLLDISFLWAKESLGIRKDELHGDDVEADRIFKESFTRDDQGRFTVALPFKPEKKKMLKTNEYKARARTRKEQLKMIKDTMYGMKVVAAHKKMIDGDYAELINELIQDGDTVHYLAWSTVFKDSSTTECRIVMDASDRPTANDVSLNQCLYQGSNKILRLDKVLLQFMVGIWRAIADIEKAFLRIFIILKDRDVLRYFFPENPLDPRSKLLVYRFKAVLFGSIASPYLLGAVLEVLIEIEWKTEYTKSAMERGIYVDNLFHASMCEDKLVMFFLESIDICKKGGFNLRQWSSNSKKIEAMAKERGIWDDSDKANALGMLYARRTDRLHIKYDSEKTMGKYTKRAALSQTNALFDPLDRLCPIAVRLRLFLRKLWKGKYGWDDDFSHDKELAKTWDELKAQCAALEDFSFDIATVITKNTQVHVFCDASTEAYGAVLYLVTPACEECPEGQIRMVRSKAKVVPVNKDPNEDTMPRWELCSILIGAFIVDYVKKGMQIEDDLETFIWNDNKPALSWCSQDEISLAFVHRRVLQIRELCPNAKIGYVPSGQNPADVLTRDTSVKDFLNNELWWKGPQWLSTPDKWPTCVEKFDLHPMLEEVVTMMQCMVRPAELQEQGYKYLMNFAEGTYRANMRALCCMRRIKYKLFLKRMKFKSKGRYKSEHISAAEYREARIVAFRLVQQECFGKELKRLQDGRAVRSGNCRKIQMA